MRPLVILRPQPGAGATAEAARQLGLEPVVAPLFRIEPVGWQPPDPAAFDALLLTSANAVAKAGDGLREFASLPVYSVGEATAASARGAGLSVAGVGTAGVDALLESIPGDLRLLHPCGIHRRAPSKRHVEALPVYEAVALPAPETLLGAADAVIAVHSPRAGRRLRELAEGGEIDPAGIGIVAISEEAATAAGPGWQAVEAAGEPTDAALLAIASRLCKNPG